MKPDNYMITSTIYYNGFEIKECYEIKCTKGYVVRGDRFYLVNGEYADNWDAVSGLISPKPKVTHVLLSNYLSGYRLPDFSVVGIQYKSPGGWSAMYKEVMLVSDVSKELAATKLKEFVEKEYEIEPGFEWLA